MDLFTARAFLMSDRLDRNKPRLPWISGTLYRYATTLRLRGRCD